MFCLLLVAKVSATVYLDGNLIHFVAKMEFFLLRFGIQTHKIEMESDAWACDLNYGKGQHATNW